MMKTAVTDNKKNLLPWGLEIELVNNRCIYMSASQIVTTADHVDVIVNKNNVISIPRISIKKLLIMGPHEGTKDT